MLPLKTNRRVVRRRAAVVGSRYSRRNRSFVSEELAGNPEITRERIATTKLVERMFWRHREEIKWLLGDRLSKAEKGTSED